MSVPLIDKRESNSMAKFALLDSLKDGFGILRIQTHYFPLRKPETIYPFKDELLFQHGHYQHSSSNSKHENAAVGT